MLEKSKLLLISCALVLGSLGGTALAGGHGHWTKKFDENGDGKLDDAEKAKMKAAREAHRAAMIAKYDANKNGVLDPGEREKMHADKKAERFKRIDTNGDGKLSKEELDAAKQKHGGGKRP